LDYAAKPGAYHRMHSFVCAAPGFPVAAGQFQSGSESCAGTRHITLPLAQRVGARPSRRRSFSSRISAAFIRIHDMMRSRCVPLQGRDCYHDSRACSHARKPEPSSQLRAWLSPSRDPVVERVAPSWGYLRSRRRGIGSMGRQACCRLPIGSLRLLYSAVGPLGLTQTAGCLCALRDEREVPTALYLRNMAESAHRWPP
jgi:hypothetical protein